MHENGTWNALWWLEKKQLRSNIKNCIFWIIIYSCALFLYGIIKSDTYMLFSTGVILLSMTFANQSYSKFARLNSRFVLIAIENVNLLIITKYILSLIYTIVSLFILATELWFLNWQSIASIEIQVHRLLIIIIWIFILPIYFIMLQFYYQFAFRMLINILSLICLNTFGVTNISNEYIYILTNVLYIIVLCIHLLIMKFRITKEHIWKGVAKQ